MCKVWIINRICIERAKIFHRIAVFLQPLFQQFLVFKSCVISSDGDFLYHDFSYSALRLRLSTKAEVKILISKSIYSGNEITVKLKGSADGVIIAPSTRMITIECFRYFLMI